MAIFRDLLRYNREFAVGRRPAGARRGLRLRCRSSRPIRRTTATSCRPTCRPRWAYWFGTTSRGQDVFWQLTFAIRNTLLFGFVVAVLSRAARRSLIGLVAGYEGGWVDRVLMSINDTFIVIPLFPILVLFYFVMRDHMSWGAAGADDGLPRLGLRRAPDPLGGAQPAAPRIHRDRHLLRHEHARRSWSQEHLPYVLPIVFSTTMNNINWSIGLEVTLSVLGFTDINTPTIGVHDLLGQPAHRAGRRHLVVDLLPGAAGRHDLHRAVPARGLDERIHRPAQPARRGPSDDARRSPSEGLRAYYRTRAFGVRATCAPSTMSASHVEAERDLRPRGRIELRQDHADQDHRRAPSGRRSRWSAARVTFNFPGGAIDMQRAGRDELAAIRWRHLSYIMQGSMSVLNPVRRVRHSFVDFAFRHIGQPMPRVPRHGARPPGARCSSSPTCSTPIRTSSPAACASA